MKKSCSMSAAAFLIAACVALVATPLPGASLEDDFKTPQRETGVYAWWHWIGYNVSKKGITRDLEAMKSAGLGGASVFTIASHGGPWSGDSMENQFCPGMSYMNDVWWDHMKFAAKEADRLGLDLGMHICPGFSVSGGTWITPEHAMKEVVWTKCRAPAKPGEPEHGPFGWYREIGEASFDGWNYRFGYVARGNRPSPAPEDIKDKALECDKMSFASVKLHLDNVLNPLVRHLGPLVGKSFRHIVMDSYEAGPCNWTQTFREDFRRLRGYDPLPFLPVLTGAKMPNADRFREDMRRTIHELVSKNHYRQIHARCAALGLEFQLEPHGMSPIFDDHDAAGRCDVPMQEFWVKGPQSKEFGCYGWHVGAVGRALGRRVIGTEAFTAMPQGSKWMTAPCDLKDSGDATFARGMNRLVLHHWAHQPFDPKWNPGNTFGPWGTHFGECNTWFDPGKAWYAYLNRCQAMLQRGESVVDTIGFREYPGDCAFDTLGEEHFVNELVVLANGDVKIKSSGRVYRLVRLPVWNGKCGGEVVSVAVARKVRDLVRGGAAVWAPKRFARAYGLEGGEAADAEVREIAKSLWETPNSRFFAKGRWQDALMALGVKPPFEVVENQKDVLRPVMGCARRDGDVPFFFVCNTSTNAVKRTLAFRSSGRVPELWDAEKATMRMAPFWSEKGGRTFMEYEFAPLESFFVVFRTSGKPPSAKPAAEKFVCAVKIEGDWDVAFQPGRGAPEWNVHFDGLQSLSEIAIPGIRYFSGTATYEKDVAMNSWISRLCTDGVRRSDFMKGGTRFVLNLGEVGVIAQVEVNGKQCGTAWHAPYRVDITDALKQRDHNKIVIRVTNTWHNRLAGDETEPDDCEWGEANAKGATSFWGRPLRRIPDFVMKNEPRPSKGRVGFCTWNYFGVNSKLQPSGLIGPVTIEKYTR